MKVNISDLLDDYREESLIAQEDTPLSLEKIQKRTMDVVAPPKKRPFRRAFPSILAAAFIVSILAVNAIAGEKTLLVSDWFRTGLNRQAREDAQLARVMELQGLWKNTIGESSLAAIDSHGKVVDQSVTDNGSTITLTALYGDEYVLYLYFQVTAPEGTQLPDGLDYYFGNGVHMTSSGSPHGAVVVPDGYMISENYGLDLKAMPDENPEDNRKDFILSLQHGQQEQIINGIPQKPWAFHDDVPKTFVAEGLYYRTENDSYEAILVGSFSFDITHPHEVSRMEIDVTGLDYSGHVDNGEWWPDLDYTVEPVRLTLSPFSAELQNRFTSSQEHQVTYLDFQIMMKDGTTERHWEIIRIDTEEDLVDAVVAFTNPIALEQIDYVVIGNSELEDPLQKVYP